MEPKSPGQFEQSVGSSEYHPSIPLPEQLGGNNLERAEVNPRGEKSAVTLAQPAPTQLPVQLPSPVSDDGAQPHHHSASNDITTAADEDLIEKEWVDKAKRVIAQTKNDPYRQEREISKLQADYLLRRYGKALGKTDRE